MVKVARILCSLDAKGIVAVSLTEEGFLELAAGVDHPGELLEVEEEAGDDVEAVDEAQREEEAPSARSRRRRKNGVHNKSISKRRFSRSHAS